MIVGSGEAVDLCFEIKFVDIRDFADFVRRDCHDYFYPGKKDTGILQSYNILFLPDFLDNFIHE